MRPSAAWPADQLPQLLSAQELAWGEALPHSRRLIFWRTRVVVRQQLAAWLGCRSEDLPLLAPPAHYPQLADGWGHVSWSHSGEQLLLGWSPQPVGVDLEPADRPIRAESCGNAFALTSRRLLHSPMRCCSAGWRWRP